MIHSLRNRFVRALAVFVLSGLCAAFVTAQPPGGPGKKGKGPKGPPPNAEFLTRTGTVKDFTTAPKGEVDGLILNDGTWVHWPPHLEGRFSDLASKGDRIKAAGYMETGPKGDTKLEVSTVTNLRTKKSVDNPDRPPPADSALGGMGGGAITKNGTVKEFTAAPKGEVDGLMLNDGTWVHWPPHLEGRFTGIAKGDKIKVIGFMETGPKGDTKLEVSSLTNLRTNKTIENPDRPVANADKAGSADERIQALEDQIEQLRQEVQRLKQKK
jgi:hypothetical protein